MTPDDIKDLVKELADSFLQEDNTTVSFVQGEKTLVYIITPTSRVDAGLIIGKGGVRIKAIENVIMHIGWAHGFSINVKCASISEE